MAQLTDLLFDHKDYSRAAPLYEKGREYERAAECYDIALEYDNAATAYRKGEKWESLIKYLNKLRGKFHLQPIALPFTIISVY